MSHALLLVAIAPTDDVEGAVAHEMEPFNENGEWFKDGSRWDWWQIGGRWAGHYGEDNVMAVGDIDLEQIKERRTKELKENHAAALADTKIGREHLEFLYGVKPDESLDAYLTRMLRGVFPAPYAFLRHRCWNERERMGFFGMGAPTECERQGKDTHICSWEQAGARIVSWGDSDSWGEKFYERFLANLPDETLLVTVDYHV